MNITILISTFLLKFYGISFSSCRIKTVYTFSLTSNFRNVSVELYIKQLKDNFHYQVLMDTNIEAYKYYRQERKTNTLYHLE